MCDLDNKDVLLNSRLASFVSTHVPQGTLVLVDVVPMPGGEMADEVDVRCLAVVYGVEVIVAVDWIESAVVGKLLFCDRRVVL